MIAALWSNSNWDDEKGTRKKSIEDLEESYGNAIRMIREGVSPEEEAEIDENNPFFAAAKRGMEKFDLGRDDEAEAGSTVAEHLEYEIDQN